ncbi:MAG: phosphate butyryltransferase [Fusobacteriaceae bacterium]
MDFFRNLKNKIDIKSKKIVAVACAQDEDVLQAIEAARKEGIIKALLVGDREKIEAIAEIHAIPLGEYEIIDIKDMNESAREAVKLVSQKKAHVVMKGLVDTSIILKAVLDSEIGLKIPGNLLSHVGIFHVDGFEKPYIVTDAAMNIAPTLEEKKRIIENSVAVAHKLGIELPKVACLCAKEKVSPKMIATVEAAELQAMNERGEIKNCLVAGPLALDNAIDAEAAELKGITHPVAGHADILLAPDIEAGNILYKSLAYFSKSEGAGMIVGASAPIVLTSRADSESTKLNSIILALATV